MLGEDVSIPALLSRTRGCILLRPPSRSLDGSRTSPVISKKLDRTVCSGAADPGFDRQVDDGQATVRLDCAAGKEPLHAGSAAGACPAAAFPLPRSRLPRSADAGS